MADIHGHGHSHAHSHSHPRRVSLSAHPGPGTSSTSTGDQISLGSGGTVGPQRRASVGDVSRSAGTIVGAEGITDIDVGEYREQDRFLPIANVSRLMKAAVPPSTKIGKDAKECVQECVSEFISFLTSEAAERSLLEKRKTIGGEDILHAMGTLGFDNYAEVLRIYLAKLREHQSTAGARAEQYIEPRGEGV